MYINKNAKFIWVEICFFSRWWEEIQKNDPEIFKKAQTVIIERQQFEIVGGGWVMPDEAVTHYSSIILQLLEGHLWIQNFLPQHVIPKTTWAIDPFGHSSTMAYINALIGFHSMAINRIHYRIKKEMALKKLLEFWWRPNWIQNNSILDIATHLFPFFAYDVPHTCGPDPSVNIYYFFFSYLLDL